MGRCYKLHTAFRDGASGGRFQFGTNFIYDNYLGHVILDSLNHHRVLFYRAGHLHTTRTSNTRDRKSTRLNSSHMSISYAVFCLKKKKKKTRKQTPKYSNQTTITILI